MNWVLRSRAQTVAAIIAFVGLFIVGFMPLFGGPGYEIALAAGLILPTLVAIATAFDAMRRRTGPFESLSRGVAAGTLLALVGYVTVIIHGIRVGFCDAAGGTAMYALGPLFGAAMGGAWGALVGELVLPSSALPLRIALAILGGAFGPLVSILLSVWRFYSTPTIFAFDPFFGFSRAPSTTPSWRRRSRCSPTGSARRSRSSRLPFLRRTSCTAKRASSLCDRCIGPGCRSSAQLAPRPAWS